MITKTTLYKEKEDKRKARGVIDVTVDFEHYIWSEEPGYLLGDFKMVLARKLHDVIRSGKFTIECEGKTSGNANPVITIKLIDNP